MRITYDIILLLFEFLMKRATWVAVSTCVFGIVLGQNQVGGDHDFIIIVPAGT